MHFLFRYGKFEFHSEQIEINQTVNCYVVNIKPKKPEKYLDIQKCIASGVKPGIMMKMLKKGETIELAGGRKVTKEDFTTTKSADYLKTYLFVDCPTTDYIPNLLNEPFLQSNHTGKLKTT